MSARVPVQAHPEDDLFTVALQGFSEFERTALASFFRLAAGRSPTYRQVDLVEECHFIIADADHAGSLKAVLAADRNDDTVFIGQRAPEGAASWLRRPIEPTRIVRELDSLVALRRASIPVSLADLAAQAAIGTAPPAMRSTPVAPPVAITAPVPPALPRIGVPAIEADRAAGRTSVDGVVAERGDAVVPEPLATMPMPMPVPGPVPIPAVTSRVPAARRADLATPIEPTGPDVLIAEDSRIARRFLQLRLQRLGYRVHLASDGDEALEQFTQRSFEIVFLDVELGSVGSIDGFALCQHLKQHPDFAGDRAPKVVFVTGLAGATDRVRGQLAGCDAYLTKPLIEADFMKALHRLDPALRARISPKSPGSPDSAKPSKSSARRSPPVGTA